jgi:hypothetical protein
MPCLCRKYRVKYLRCHCIRLDPVWQPRVCGESLSSKGSSVQCPGAEIMIRDIDEVCPKHRQPPACFDPRKWKCCQCGMDDQIGDVCINTPCTHPCCSDCDRVRADGTRISSQGTSRGLRSSRSGTDLSDFQKTAPTPTPSGSSVGHVSSQITAVTQGSSRSGARPTGVQETPRAPKSPRSGAAQTASQYTMPPIPSVSVAVGSIAQEACWPLESPRAGGEISGRSTLIRPIARRIEAPIPGSGTAPRAFPSMPLDLRSDSVSTGSQSMQPLPPRLGTDASNFQSYARLYPPRSGPQEGTLASRSDAAPNDLQAFLRSESAPITFQRLMASKSSSEPPSSGPGPGIKWGHRKRRANRPSYEDA